MEHLSSCSVLLIYLGKGEIGRTTEVTLVVTEYISKQMQNIRQSHVTDKSLKNGEVNIFGSNRNS
jgi:hypothetical protein